MCIAAPGIVIKINGREANVDYKGLTQKAMIGVESLKVGDYVLVQMGIIVKIIDKKENKTRQEAWQTTT